MAQRFSPPQRAALRLARRGALVRCRHGYRGGSAPRFVAVSTVASLVVRGWLVVSKQSSAGDPVEVSYVGAQMEIPFDG